MGEYYYKNVSEESENRLAIVENELDMVKEQYGDAVRAMLAMDNVGWNLYSGLEVTEGFDIEQLKEVARQLREWTDTNPLLFRGWDIRCDYMFGGGYEVETTGATTKISQRIQTIIDKDINQNTVFSEEALKNMERNRYTDAGVFLLYDKKTNVFQQIPLWQITRVITDPDNPAIKWFYQRTWTTQVLNPRTGMLDSESERVWYRTDTADATYAPKVTKIIDDPVEKDIVIVDDLVNVHAGHIWGIPDSFTAAPWALAYSAYLKDGSKVLAALAEFAWKLTPKTKSGADAAGERIKSAAGVAGTAVTDMDMQSLPRANAVDLNTGRPLAAQVASSLGLSVIILLSDPGTGGAYATANTLTDPSTRTLLARQRQNGRFLERCLRLIGIKDPKIVWEKMNPDADYREMQTMTEAIATGAFWPDEYREALADLAHLTLQHDSVPEGYLLPNNAASWQLKAIDPAVDPNAPAPSPGGASPARQGVGTKQTPATKKPSYGVNDLRGTGGRPN
jgi:hypothetical protein